MRAVPGTETMGMRFLLRERWGDREFKRVRAKGLGVWHRSRPGVRRFVHRQEVLELAEGSDYRVRVQFRWYDAKGKLVRRGSRRSASCHQEGDLANLVVTYVDGEPVSGSPGVTRYVVRVVNRGSALADGVRVGLAVDGAKVDTVVVGALEPGEARSSFVNGPRCTGSVRAEADPADTVVEGSESDNVFAAPCPDGS
jgi:hypothetical protein